MSVLTTLPLPRWRMLILLERYNDRATYRRLDWLMVTANASLDDILELEEQQLLQASTIPASGTSKLYVDASLAELVRASGRTQVDARRVRLAITVRGRRWLNGNPANRVIRALAETAESRRLLHEVVAEADVDLPTLDLLYHLDLVSIFSPEGRSIAPSLLNTGAPQRSRQYRIKLTAKGRDLLRQ